MPNKAFIYALAIELKDLWKIRAPVGATQGVDLTHFDKLIMVPHLNLILPRSMFYVLLFNYRGPSMPVIHNWNLTPCGSILAER